MEDFFGFEGRYLWGILTGLNDMLTGLMQISASTYAATIYAFTKPFGICPDFLANYVESTKAGYYQILADPLGTLAAMGNQIMDGFDEDYPFTGKFVSHCSEDRMTVSF
ncbi:MAG: hypothetical protein LBH87_00585 [Coriobacteriales bacterium]|jgi:hypothetical protein|nr:hypothetical protein [Coriobacteriales bacterium]